MAMIIDVKGYEGLYQIDEDCNVYSYKKSELLEMYSSIKVSQRELARMFNVSRGAIANVINNYEREVA